MITFIHPFSFVWLVLAVPLILFYLWRTRRPHAEVATGALWRRAIPILHPRRAWQGNRWFVSLLIQLLTLVVLATALAEPCWRRPQRVALILDCTSSMGVLHDGESRVQTALQKARELVEKLAYNDSMAVIVVGDGVQILSRMSNNRVAIRALLDDPENVPTPGGNASIEDAVSMARSLITAATGGVLDPENHHVVLVSDGCFPRAENVLAGDAVRWVAVGKSVGNVEVERLVPARRFPEKPGAYEVLVTLRNHFGQPADGELALKFDSETVATRPVHIPAEAQLAEVFTGTDPAKRAVSVAFIPQNAGSDALGEDNALTASLPAAFAYRVTLVTSGERNTLLESAIRQVPGVTLQTRVVGDGKVAKGADSRARKAGAGAESGVETLEIAVCDRVSLGDADVAGAPAARRLMFAPPSEPPYWTLDDGKPKRDYVLMPWLDGLRNGISTAGVGFTGTHDYRPAPAPNVRITPWLFSQSALETGDALGSHSAVDEEENFAKGAKTVELTELAWGLEFAGNTGVSANTEGAANTEPVRVVLAACDLSQSDWLLEDDFPRFLQYAFDWLADSEAPGLRLKNGLEPRWVPTAGLDSNLNVPPPPEAQFTLRGEDIVPMWTLLILILIPACAVEWALYQRRWLE